MRPLFHVTPLALLLAVAAPSGAQEPAPAPAPPAETPPAPPAPAETPPAPPAPAETAPVEPAPAEPSPTKDAPPEPPAVEQAPAPLPTSAAGAEQPKATDRVNDAGYMPGYRRLPSLGLSPYVPRVPALTPGVSSSFGTPTPDHAWNFDFHGYASAGYAVGINTRRFEAGGEQSDTALHSDPEVPGPYGSFEFTGTVPGVWAQLNFMYGNEDVQATVIVAGWRVARAEGYYLPAGHLGINDAFLTFKIADQGPVKLGWRVGAFADRYGAMGHWGDGPYGTSIVGGTQGVGETLTALLTLDPSWQLIFEHGVKTTFEGSPQGQRPGDPSIGWAYPEAGTTVGQHAHAGLRLKDKIELKLHYLSAIGRDDRSDYEDDPLTPENESHLHKDGQMTVVGADLRIDAEHLGFFMLGAGMVDVEHGRSLQPQVLTVLNAGGRGLQTMLGPTDIKTMQDDVGGRMLNAGLNYEVSLGRLARYPHPFDGNGPDLRVNVFGIYQKVDSIQPDYDGDQRLKFGADFNYPMLPWLALAGRFDRVMPELDESSRSFTIVSPRLVFRTNWQSREQVYLQYAHWFYGDAVTSESRISEELDRDMVAISGSMWF